MADNDAPSGVLTRCPPEPHGLFECPAVNPDNAPPNMVPIEDVDRIDASWQHLLDGWKKVYEDTVWLFRAEKARADAAEREVERLKRAMRSSCDEERALVLAEGHTPCPEKARADAAEREVDEVRLALTDTVGQLQAHADDLQNRMLEQIIRADAAEREVERETELRRKAEAHNRELRAALEVHPFPDEYESEKARADRLAKALRRIITGAPMKSLANRCLYCDTWSAPHPVTCPVSIAAAALAEEGEK